MRIIFVLILLIVLSATLLWVLSATPAVSLPASITAIGQATPVTVQVSDPHGIRRLTVFVEQNDARYKAWEIEQAARRIWWQRGVPDTAWSFNIGAKTTPQLRDGKARLIVEATSNDFRAKTISIEREVTVGTHPPALSLDSDQHYLYLGMADLVTFSVSGYWTEAGVRVGKEEFRSWPMPGGKPGLFSLFAFAWNMPPGTAPVVYATNPAGNEVRSQMAFQFPKSEQPRYRVRDLQLDDRFLEKVVNELDPNGSGDPVARFLKINGEMRRANNQTLSELRFKTEPRFLWSHPFLQQPNSVDVVPSHRLSNTFRGRPRTLRHCYTWAVVPPIVAAAPAWSIRLITELDAADERAKELVIGLDPEQLNWQPRPGAWSIGQCLEHLCISNEAYLPAMSSALEGKPVSAVEEITPGWFGRWFIRSYIEPSLQTKQARAPKKIVPGERVDPSVLDRFLRSNQAVRELARRARDYDVNRIRFRNPFVPIIHFTVGTGLEIISRHERRHLLQAERVRQSAGFPG